MSAVEPIWEGLETGEPTPHPGFADLADDWCSCGHRKPHHVAGTGICCYWDADTESICGCPTFTDQPIFDTPSEETTP